MLLTSIWLSLYIGLISIVFRFYIWLGSQAAKTPPFHGGNAGSTPAQVANSRRGATKMTRQNFIDDVNSFWELIEFCDNERLDTCADVIYGDYLGEYIMRTIRQDFDTWQGIRDYLSDIQTGGEFYAEDGYGNIICVDDMFDSYKEDVIRTMDQCESWDEDEEEDAVDDTGSSVSSAYRVEDEDIDIDDASFLAVVGRSMRWDSITGR